MTIQSRKLIYGSNRYRLIIEAIVLYLVLPLLVMLDLLPVPLMVLLMLMGISVYLYLRFDTSFDRQTLINWQKGKREMGSIMLMFLAAAVIMVALIRIIDAEKLFQLVRINPLLLLAISIFYPVFSVIPQGLIYRSLFFHRYGVLFRGTLPRIIASAALFSFGHILYKNWLVLLLTFLAGMIFAWRYNRSKSLAASIIEQALYGVWLFTCGLGYFFVSSFVD